MAEPDRAHEARVAEALALTRQIVAKEYNGKAWPRDRREDLVGAVMLKYTTKWPQGSPPDGPGAWLRTVIRTTAIDKQRVEKTATGLDGDSDDAPHAANDPLTVVINAFRQSPSLIAAWNDLERRVFGVLKPADRYLLEAKHLRNRSAQELASHLGITVAAVEKRLSRARQVVRESLEADPGLLEELRAGMPRLHQHRQRRRP